MLRLVVFLVFSLFVDRLKDDPPAAVSWPDVMGQAMFRVPFLTPSLM